MKRKKLSREEIREKKLQLIEKIRTGELSIGQATREMRKIIGLTQLEYAGVLGIFPRVLMDIEKDKGNPTLETLQKVGKPFGLKIGFVRPARGISDVGVTESPAATNHASASVIRGR